MNVKDLRIGNFLSKDGNIIKITARDIFEIEQGSDRYHPVPLSDEWFKNRFSFVVSQETFEKYIVIIYRHYYTGHPKYFFDYEGSRIYVEFVHQIQNLYYTILMEELEFSTDC